GPESFWQMLSDGIDSIGPIPPERWNIDEYYDADPQTPGKMYIREGGFIDTPIDQFDRQFFGISPREAEWMDPQQRLVLEVAWEALENAAIVPADLAGTATGVFIGISNNEFALHLSKHFRLEEGGPYWATGNACSVIPGRLSYVLGTQGPCMTIDTACSSALVAVHTACRSLLAGESNCAIAGGVSVILAPEVSVSFCKAGLLSRDNRCKAFDAEANGIVRSEGCGLLVLKRLSDARRDGDRILAIIRATGVNQDGASGGLTVPNGEAQEKLMRDVLKTANLSPLDIDVIEAHGTGTPLGDPIELNVIKRVFCQDRGTNTPLLIGSVKTNLGHLEAAAGIAGLIKTVLALQNEAVPAHLHFKNLNPVID
ncbi:MAG: type I polyketide synthase, partial [Terriglobales bacterium]